MWVFPSGCQTACQRITNNVLTGGTLIGPNLPLLPYWAWLIDGFVIDSGTISLATPFPVSDTGTYTLQMDTGSGCLVQSDEMEYNSLLCATCHIESITHTITAATTDFCSFNLALTINSNSTFEGVIASPDNNVIISPSSVSIASGIHNYHFTVIPIMPFTPGVIYLQITGTEEGQPCIYNFNINVPACLNAASSTRLDTGATTSPLSVVLAPNPTKDQVTVYYKGMPNAAEITIYDVMGRSMASYPIAKSEGVVTIATEMYPKGIYIVVVRSGDGLLSQQKLIIE